MRRWRRFIDLPWFPFPDRNHSQISRLLHGNQLPRQLFPFPTAKVLVPPSWTFPPTFLNSHCCLFCSRSEFGEMYFSDLKLHTRKRTPFTSVLFSNGLFSRCKSWNPNTGSIRYTELLLDTVSCCEYSRLIELCYAGWLMVGLYTGLWDRRGKAYSQDRPHLALSFVVDRYKLPTKLVYPWWSSCTKCFQPHLFLDRLGLFLCKCLLMVWSYRHS